MGDMGMDVDTMAREKPKLRLRLSQDIFPEDTAMEDMVMEVTGMDVDIMVRERLKPSQDILEVMVVMVMVVDMEDMAMDVDTMARGKQMLNLDILEDTVDIAEDMATVVMAMA